MLTDKNGNILKPGDKVLVEMTVAQVQEHIHESFYQNAYGPIGFKPNGKRSISIVLTAEEYPKLGVYNFIDKGEYEYFRSLSFNSGECNTKVQKI